MDKILNLLSIPNQSDSEIFETIFKNKNMRVERIISYGQSTPDDFWYDQDEDEFVVVLEGFAKILYDINEIYELKKDESLLIPSHQKHKVIYTTNPTIWLCIFTKE